MLIDACSGGQLSSLCKETSHVGAAMRAQSHIMGNSLKGKAHSGDKDAFIDLFTFESFQDVLYRTTLPTKDIYLNYPIKEVPRNLYCRGA